MTDRHSPPLTAARIDSIKPDPTRRLTITDPASPGLQLRVTPRGVKSFCWYVVVNGKMRTITLGTWSKVEKDGHITLADARKLLERLKAAHKTGRLTEMEAELAALRPKALRARASAAERNAVRTVAALAHDYLRGKERTVEKPEQIERVFRRRILPAMGEYPITDVRPRDCAQLVASVAESGHRSAAGKVLRQLKEVFDFAINRGELEVNPAAALKGAALGVEGTTGTRYLTAEEVPLFWRGLDDAVAAERMRSVNAVGLKALLATGVRSCELYKARWEDVDFDAATWSIPVANQKMKKKLRAKSKPWIVPLSSLALSLFRELAELAGDSPFVMDQTGGEKVFARAMTRLCSTLTLAEPQPTPHDLRRTVRTHLSELGVAWHVAERCLNHSLGGITKVYDVGDYREERKAALEKWGAYVQRLVEPSSSNVRFLAR